jgi:hypothetical protein
MPSIILAGDESGSHDVPEARRDSGMPNGIAGCADIPGMLAMSCWARNDASGSNMQTRMNDIARRANKPTNDGNDGNDDVRI